MHRSDVYKLAKTKICSSQGGECNVAYSSAGLYLLAVWEGIWAALLLESFMEAWFYLHPLTDIIDDPDGQTLCCHNLQVPRVPFKGALQSPFGKVPLVVPFKGAFQNAS